MRNEQIKFNFAKILQGDFLVKRNQSFKSGRAFRAGFGPKINKISGLIWARDVLFVLDAQKDIQTNLATLLNFSDLT